MCRAICAGQPQGALQSATKIVLGRTIWTGPIMEEWERLLNELGDELRLRERELELLHRIDLYLLEPEQSEDIQSAQDIFEIIVQETGKLLHASHTTILLRRSTFLEPKYSDLRTVVG